MNDMDDIYRLKQLMVDGQMINRIVKDLQEISGEVHHTGFQKYTVKQAVYGDSAVGGSLGYHHSLAHQKVSDSLTAVLKDLNTFRDGFLTFQNDALGVDDGSASASRKISQAIEALNKSAGFDHTHQVDHHYHPGGTDA